MGSNRLNHTLRQHAKTQRFGPDANCQRCGESDTRTLQDTTVRTRPTVLCAECRLAIQGKPTTERHHPAGRHNDAYAAPFPANTHAVLSDAQYDWPDPTRLNPDGDFLIRLAAWFRFFADTFAYLSTRARVWAETLEIYTTYLTEQLGPQWWTAMDVEVTP
jgi:hypothetical protein